MKEIQVLVFAVFSGTLPSLSFLFYPILFRIPFLPFMDTLEFCYTLENDISLENYLPTKKNQLFEMFSSLWNSIY